MNWGSTEVQIIKKWDLDVFVLHMILKICEGLHMKLLVLRFTIYMRILNGLDHELGATKVEKIRSIGSLSLSLSTFLQDL